jgi:hypothetical protein
MGRHRGSFSPDSPMSGATLDDGERLIRLPALAARFALTPGAVRHAIQRQQWHRIPPPHAIDPYRWKVATVDAFLARPPAAPARARGGYRWQTQQRRMFDRFGSPLAQPK